MAELKTKPTGADPRPFVEAIADEVRRADCRALLDLMESESSEPPRMWGDSIIGFGSYDYRYASGRSGTWFRTGFANRKQALTLYLMMDLDANADLLAALGKHNRGRSCLYVRRLADLNEETLRLMVRKAFDPTGSTCCGGGH